MPPALRGHASTGGRRPIAWTPRCCSAPSRPACLQRGTSLDRRAHVAGVRRNDLTEAQWRRLEPLLPPERRRKGRPNHHHRTIVNGILWILRTGAPWRDLPERYGAVGTVSSRF